jgi:hypothetical protein
MLRNFHRFLGSPEVVRALDTAISAGKRARTFVLILSPVVQIPVELEGDAPTPHACRPFSPQFTVLPDGLNGGRFRAMIR